MLALLVLLGGYTVAQLTSRASADRLFVRALPELTDLDHDLADHYAELQSQATTPGAASGMALPAYPIRLALRPNEVLGRSPAQVHQTVVAHAADELYDHGLGALLTTSNKPVSFGRFSLFSAPRLFQMELDVLSPRFHHHARVAMWLALVAVAVIAVGLFFLSRDYNRIVMYGVALVIAAVPVLALSLIAWLGVQLASARSADPFVGGVSDIARDAAWYFVLSYVVYIVVALGLIALGLLTERFGESAVSAGGRLEAGEAEPDPIE